MIVNALITTFLILFLSSSGFAQSEAVLIDFSNTNIVTKNDTGFNDFSGNMGVINKKEIPYGVSNLLCTTGNNCTQQLQWNFGSTLDAYTGFFLSLFGLTDTLVTFDGGLPQKLYFSEHVLDLDNVDGELQEPEGARSFTKLGIQIKNNSMETVTLRVELSDPHGGMRYTRFTIAAAEDKNLLWDFRNDLNDGSDLDIHSAKILSLVIERQHVADNVSNPPVGSIAIKRIWFETNRAEIEPADDTQLLDLTKRRSAQYFIDWSSRKTETKGIPQDRSTFGDLLTVGGVGFALPAYIISAHNGWLDRNAAANNTLSVLKTLDNQEGFGPEPIGRIGYQGWFYHFLDILGQRKLNFDYAETTTINEAGNTVEVSTIDTGLALMGVLASQSYFTGSDPVETEIRTRAQSIYDRVDWDFMYNIPKRQFVHGWKPNEARNPDDFTVPDGAGLGKYSKGSWDYYTDEALIIALLAAGANIDASDFYCSLNMLPDNTGLIRTYPGALFTYQFLHAFINTNPSASNGLPLLNACPEESLVNWYDNSRKAIQTTIGYAESNPKQFASYEPNAWGISAAEGPHDLYHAYGVPSVAVVNTPAVTGQNLEEPFQDGTVTYYGMVSSVSFGADLKNKVVQALRAAWAKGHWHYRFALPDAFNDQISQVKPDPTNLPTLLRTDGPWLQRPLFAIDQGPMLLHLENEASGLIWNLLAQNLNIRRGVNALNAPRQTIFEGEEGTGSGRIMPRSNASQKKTAWLMDGESRQFRFNVLGEKQYVIKVRYSNDNYGPLEVVSILIDDVKVGEFQPQDTGDFGHGWNVFLTSDAIGPATLGPGSHVLSLQVAGGDNFGVEIDAVTLECTTNSVATDVTGNGGTIKCTPASTLYGRSSRCVIAPITAPHPTYLTALTDNSSNVLDKIVDATYTLGNVTTGHQLAAVFEVKPVRNSATDMYYVKLQDACNSATDGNKLLLRSVMFGENLVVNTLGTLTFLGGYDSSYVPTSSPSIIKGSVKVSMGKLVINKVVIQ